MTNHLRFLALLFCSYIPIAQQAQEISFESYTSISLDLSKTFRSNTIVSFDPSNEELFLLNTNARYHETNRLRYGAGLGLEYTISKYSVNNGALISDSAFSIFKSRENSNTFISARDNGTAFFFFTLPEKSIYQKDEMIFSTPCKRIGYYNVNASSQQINHHSIISECKNISLINLGFTNNQKVSCIYEKEEENYLRSWAIGNPSSVSEKKIPRLSSLAYFNETEEVSYYLSEVDYNQSFTSGILISLNANEEVNSLFSVESSIKNPRLVASSSSLFLFEPYKEEFKVQKFNNNGVKIQEVTVSGVYSNVVLINTNRIALITSNESGGEIILLDSDLNILGTVDYGVPMIKIHSTLYDEEVNSLFLSGIVESETRFDDFRKPNSAVLIKVTLEDLSNSIKPSHIFKRQMR